MNITNRRKWLSWTPVGVAGAVSGLALLLVAPAGAAPTTAQPHPKASTNPLDPPPQMKSLFAMLGKYKCPEQVPPGQTGETGFETNTKGLGGHYLDTAVEIPGVLHGRTQTGWDSVNGRYFALYADDWGSNGTATSPGWVNGHLVLTGPQVQATAPSSTGHATGITVTLSEDYQVVGKGHYIAVQTITTEAGQTFKHTYDCRLV